jgi:hypothetical protein
MWYNESQNQNQNSIVTKNKDSMLAYKRHFI